MTDSATPSGVHNPRKGLPLWVIVVAGVVLLSFLIVLVLGLSMDRQQTLKLGSKVPDFTLSLFDGSQVSLSSLQGKTVLINFWASWCTTCVDEASILQKGWQEVAADGEYVFIGIDYADTESAAKDYLKKYSIDYLNGPDLRSKISQLFRISGVPETYLIDADGILRAIKIGPFSSAEELQTFIDMKSGN